LDVLAHTPAGKSATKVRHDLSAFGEDRAGPKFYQMMGRLERGGFIESWSQQFDVGGSMVSRTYYRVTAQGRATWQRVLDFYEARLHDRHALPGHK
jgi:DNA-binding PadR family transcriptional regulator